MLPIRGYVVVALRQWTNNPLAFKAITLVSLREVGHPANDSAIGSFAEGGLVDWAVGRKEAVIDAVQLRRASSRSAWMERDRHDPLVVSIMCSHANPGRRC